jgi:S-adenosylmethionine:tRNA ribosyltransferase-isomerase
MKRSAFHYVLPPELIAQAPLERRSASRLLELDGETGRLANRRFVDLVELLAPGDLVVCNDTRVLPARLLGRKPTGGRVEIMLERPLGRRRALVQLRASHLPQLGGAIELPDGARATVERRIGPLFEIALDVDLEPLLHVHGDVPLPPYIDRAPQESDRERYQTVFAREPGAVAAPTAGLHFDAALFAALERRGVERTFVTLHVGAGTFSPVRSEDVERHELHAERVRVSPETCAAVARCRARGGRVVAVGTTTVRSLETAALQTDDDQPAPFDGDSRLFVVPGFRFRVVDALVTNFHLPQSSLLMLVAAFAGLEHTLAAYRHAVEQKYRFFSYGDAMFVTPSREARARRATPHAV